MEFRFPQFHHGAIELDADLKCAETFVVFARDTTAKERAWIEAECPEPVRSFCWAERFAYFGSAGDTFDFDVVAAFGGDEVAALREAGDWTGVMAHIPEAMTAFVAAYDAWLEKVHTKVPIAFAHAAGPTNPDDWAEWSTSRADDALAALRATRAAHGWLAKPSTGTVPKPADRLAPRSRAAECFGWIERAVSELAANADLEPEHAAERLDAVAEQLEAIEVPLPLARLSITEHHIHTTGAAFAKVLDALGDKARGKAIAALSPRARLVYYASYTALDNGDLAAAGRDLAKSLDAIAAKLPADQQWRAAALLAFAAANLAHVTPGFDRPDKKQAKPALALFRRAIDRGARCAEELAAAMTCAKAANDKRALLDIATRAIDATRDPSVAKAAAKHARALRDAKAAKLFEARGKAIAASSKLAQSKQPVAKLVSHLDAGGEPTTDLLGNLAVRLDASTDRGVVAAHVKRVAEVLLREPAFGTHPDVALNFCVMAGNDGKGDRAIEVIEQLLDRGLALSEQLGLSLTYAATIAKKPTAKKQVIARLAEANPGDASPLTLSNLAVVHVHLGDKAAAIAALAQARELGHPTFAALRRDKDFAALHGYKPFEVLFA